MARDYGDMLAGLLQSLGPLFVKGGQLLATRTDLIHPQVAAALSTLHAAVRPDSWERIAGELQRSLPAPWSAVFSEVDPVPIAAGAIAQVHRAVLRDGRRVVLKIRRPAVEEFLSVDLALMASLVAWIQQLPGLGGVPVAEAFVLISDLLRRQADFAHEAGAMAEIAGNFAGSSTVLVPRAIEGLCGESLITMETMGPLNRLSAELLQGRSHDVAVRCTRALFQMIFTDGCVHGDMHPGNVWCSSRGEIVLLDFGMVARLRREERLDFVDFFLGFVRGEADTCAGVVMRTASRVPATLDRSSLVGDIGTILRRYAGRVASEFQVSRFVLELFDVQRRHGIHSTAEFVIPILSILSLEGTLKTLAPALDFQSEARPFLIGALTGVAQRCD